MKKIITGCLLLVSTMVFAADPTDMQTKWVCTTNASSSDNPQDKAADDQMTNKQESAAHSFEFAAQNCRDCTKITCEKED